MRTRNQQRQSPDDVFGVTPPSRRYELLLKSACASAFAVGVVEKAADSQCDLKGLILPKRRNCSTTSSSIGVTSGPVHLLRRYRASETVAEAVFPCQVRKELQSEPAFGS